MALVAGSALALACSSSSAPGGGAATDGGATTPLGDGGTTQPATAVTEHGTIVDEETLKPVAGLTVTDGPLTTTTDAQGAWSLTTTAGAVLLPVVTGPKYSRITFPTSTAAGSDVDFKQQVIPDSSTFTLEQTLLGNDRTKALVHVVVFPTGACTTAVGGTIAITAPDGTKLMYFTAANVPDSSTTTIQDVTGSRPAAVIYDLPPGAAFSVSVTHPTCTQVPFPAVTDGKALTGTTTTTATAPGGDSSAIGVVLK